MAEGDASESISGLEECLRCMMVSSITEIGDIVHEVARNFDERLATLENAPMGASTFVDRVFRDSDDFRNSTTRRPSGNPFETDCQANGDRDVRTSSVSFPRAAGMNPFLDDQVGDRVVTTDSCGIVGPSTTALRTPVSSLRESLGKFIKFKPQLFDGKVSWIDYHRQFEIIATRNHCSEAEKANALASQLRGYALLVLSSFSRWDQIDYGALCQILDQRYGTDQSTCLTQFRFCVQKPKESITEFSISLRRLAVTAFPECPPDVIEKTLKIAQKN